MFASEFIKKSWKLYLFIILISFPPLIDIFKTADLPHTSDGAMHLARFAAYYKEFTAGQFPVRWASQFNYGYGTPIFNFFHPLPYLAGIPLIALGLSLVNVLKVSFSFTYILAGVFMLMFSRFLFKDEKKALLVTVMYQFAPFRFVEMLVRGSLGSLYAYMILPLVFYAVVKFLDKSTYLHFILIAVSVALLSMSHNIIGFVFFAISVFYLFFTKANLKKTAAVYFAMAAGLGMAGFYLIPAMIEHKYTYGYLLTKDLFYEHFPPFYKFIIPNITNTAKLRIAEVSIQIGLFHILGLLITIYLLIRGKLQKMKLLAIYSLVVTAVALLFMQPVTKPIWENVSFIRQFQFSWRLLAVICFTSSLTSVFIYQMKFFQKRMVYFGLIILIIISTVYYWVPYQGYQKVSQEFYWNYPKSTNYFGEINSIWMAGEPKEYPKSRIDIIAGQAEVSNVKLFPELHRFLVSAKTQATLLDYTQFYPGWKVIVDNNPASIQFQDMNHRGLITFNVPAGDHIVSVQYTQNRLQTASNLISILLVLVLVTGIFIYRGKNII
ncbi:MAG: hypothetical protein A2857_03510 [Candidatus Levybacteria bacterium RIFCSPHIGHO2_01_FULL_36_15]|nr:MAG: hypothetical protein A2857_03510 [Candidatus Levybacteria bacterium RIFCSPHIGHO2_01_FULL_36_15]OGH37877.1 MAG: hypothetical protein A2905_02150 [Candidatus Levybacteria bacterium RIFCSPLOWO2_01_FULL_36_10]